MDNSVHHLRIYEPVFCLHESNGLAHFSSPHLFCLKLTIHTFFFFRSFHSFRSAQCLIPLSAKKVPHGSLDFEIAAMGENYFSCGHVTRNMRLSHSCTSI